MSNPKNTAVYERDQQYIMLSALCTFLCIFSQIYKSWKDKYIQLYIVRKQNVSGIYYKEMKYFSLLEIAVFRFQFGNNKICFYLW